ncbi:hypothetical protein FM038_009800 [Shewanella eurypsychrophilus]|uniref:Uncharacterized protein n=1 Tax=Shewanella eurypsychrophilus TaxID=2593656 RepID=A0ABX6V5N4_9GAMM|nr:MULTISPECIES: DUF6508 domain-containing protein [Shewanella]QFU22418.1 hypothetical protein FS418_11380 [Shewanella sp. YLB-09]QPG57705.1 hypothetical protein FM038_009800 [Shewanella eurypsychrophilus]
MKQLFTHQTSNLYAKYVNILACGEKPISVCKIQEFTDDLAKSHLLLSDFKWDEWYQNSHLVDRPDYIADATLHECQLLLTAMTRLECFSPGVMDNMRRQGVLIAILERYNNFSMKLAC